VGGSIKEQSGGFTRRSACPRISVDGEDDQNLEGMEAFEGCLVRLSRDNECRKLDKVTALQLDVVESWNRLFS
jgi:hypothetical protein